MTGIGNAIAVDGDRAVFQAYETDQDSQLRKRVRTLDSWITTRTHV